MRQLRGVVAGRVRLGTSASISVYLLPLALQKFRARFPDIDLVVVTGLAPDIARGVVANDLDLGLVSLPVLTSQWGHTEEQLRAAGVTKGMLRLSVGLEDAGDIIADLEQALAE